MSSTKVIDTNTNDALQTALDYAQHGWSVLPLHTPTNGGCSCRKQYCTSAGKHPRLRNGLKAASTDESFLRQWWAKWPDANVGVVTGAVSGIVVLDVDDGADKSGSTSLVNLEDEHGVLPTTLTCVTGKGRHHYFRHPGVTVKNSASKIGQGLDLRADGGYVVAAPSRHSNGKLYTWVNPGSEIASLPAWLLSNVRDDGATDFAPGEELVAVGSRNNSLTRLGGRLRARGLDEGEIEAELLDANTTRLAKPLPLDEVRGIAASLAKYPPGQLKLPWFMFFPSEWFGSNAVRLGCDTQRGWLIHLLAECWRQGGVLPNDPEMLWRLAGALSSSAFERNGRNLLVLTEFELRELEDGSQVLLHPWMAKHYQEQAQKYLQRCAAGAASAVSRKRANNEAALADGRCW
jgi:hypothetical protein